MQEPCDFTFYSDYYAFIARAGIDSAQSLFRSIEAIQKIDITTFDRFENAQANRDDFDFNIRTSYEEVFTSMISTVPMETSFTALSRHIRQIEGYADVNAFVEFFGIRVLPTYAALSNIFGETIEAANIRNLGDASTCT